MKRVLSLVLALVMVFGTIMPAFAESTDSQAGQDLESYGIIAGDGTGLNESGTLTRAEMTVILAKLNGKATEAAAYAFESAFTDDADAWYTPWVAYAATQGWMAGYPDNTFKPSNVISVQEVNLLMVQALGYDVEWATANATATDLGVAVTAKDAAKVLRGEIFTTLRAALDVNAKDATDTLGTALALTGYVSPTPATPETLEITKVMSDNLKTVIVEFNQELNKKTVTTTNFSVTGLTVEKALLSEDMKTVTLQMEDSIAQSKEVELVIEDVKTTDDGLTIADYKMKHIVNDVTIPVIESLTVVDAKHVTIQASEPMDWEAVTFTVLAGAKLDGKSFVGKVEADHQNFVYTIEFNSVKKEGSYTLNVEGIKDFAGLAAVKKDFAFDVAKDETAPVALSAEAVNVNSVEVTFDEPIDTLGTILLNGKTTDLAVKANSAGKIIVATFDTPEDKLTLGATVEVIVKYKGQKDVVGNEVKTETTLTFKVEDDTTMPTASIEVKKANKVVITFSKSMDTDLGKIIVMDTKKKVKKTVAVTDLASTKWSETNTILTLVGSDLGLDNINPVDRIIQLKDMKDNTVRANLLTTTDFTVAVLDTKLPTVTNAYTVDAKVLTGTDPELDDQITFYFSEAMDAETVKNLSNFKNNAKTGTFATEDGVKFKSISADGKSATFTYPSAGTFAAPTAPTFTVFAVKDLAGNMVATVVSIGLNVNELTAAPTAVAVADNKIEVTYSVNIATADPSSIRVEGLTETYTTSISSSIDENVVTYTLAKALPTNTTGYTLVLNNTELLVTEFGGEYAAATVWAPAVVITDEIVPTIKSMNDGKKVTTVEALEVTAPNFATLKFSEAIQALPVDLLLLQSDLVVKLNDKILSDSDYTLTLVDGNFVVIEVFSNDKVTTDDKYTLSVQVVRKSELMDTIGNELEPVTESITDFDYDYTAPPADVTAPVITAADETVAIAALPAWTETVSANDVVDGVITGSVVATYFESDGTTSIANLAAAKTYIDDASVNTTFVINYNVSDAASNAAIEKVVTITITPADLTAPVITAADETVAVLALPAWTETVSANDDVDGVVTGSVVATYFESDGTTSIANLAAAKTYIDDASVNTTFVINYNVSDAASNAAIEKVVTITVTP